MIDKGCWIQIKKGTVVYTNSLGVVKQTKQTRDVIVVCKDIVDLNERDNWKWMFMLEDESRAYKNAQMSNGFFFSTSNAATDAPFKKAIIDRVGTHAVIFGDDKRVSLTDVVEAAEPVTTKPKKIAIRNQLVKGSEWRFTKDASIIYKKRNPHRRSEGYVDIELVKVEVGDTFKVLDKSRMDYDNGNITPVEFKGKAFNVLYASYRESDVSRIAWPIKQFQDIVEPIHIPETNVFVFRDKDTGLFFSSTSYTNKPVMGTYGSAKKYKKLNDMRGSVMSFIGYFDGTENNAPDWLQGPKQFDVPASWEIVRFDKLSKEEKAVLDIEESLKLSRLHKLRDLAVRGGASLRELYEKVGKKKKDEVFIASLLHDSEAGKLNKEFVSEASQLHPIEEFSTQRSTAYAFSDASDALILKMKFDNIVVMSTKTLNEIYG